MRDSDLMERYLRGELGGAEREAFEEHYFECDDCFERVEAIRDVRDALAAHPEDGYLPARPAASWWTPWRLAVAAVLALALIAVGVIALREQPRLSEELAALAGIEPPAYEPVVLRGTEGDADRLFVEAMEHYVAGDFGAAASGLDRVVQIDPDSPRGQFYLAASYLLTDRTEPGIGALGCTIALGESPYLEEAHLLLAKARLTQGDLDAARQALEDAVALDGDFEDEARALLDRLLELSRSSPAGR